MTGRRVRRPTLFSLWRKARRENSAASRLLGSTSLRFALHGWQRPPSTELFIMPRFLKSMATVTGENTRKNHNLSPYSTGYHNCRQTDQDISAKRGSTTSAGSSPRVWGTRGLAMGAASSARFIPTGVGNTEKASPTAWESSVHPHGCGEHIKQLILSKGTSGSSPRVWGTPGPVRWGLTSLRFIPTGVGNTDQPVPANYLVSIQKCQPIELT